MYELNLANNITRLRHERNITQEELADFLGVTKASVSKWEMPRVRRILCCCLTGFVF